MDAEPMTRGYWTELCAAEVNRRLGGGNMPFAEIVAKQIADNQDGDVSTWPDPEEAANDELDCWD